MTLPYFPSISVCIPVLNSEPVIKECLMRLERQDYPKEKIELIVADGGSTDRTREIAEEFGALIISNPFKTGEAGKAAAVRHAKNELMLFLDSDNFLPDPGWLKQMIAPFADPDITLSEPIRFTWRSEGGFIERYSALIGMNDPLCLFIGNYDRYSLLTGKWTDIRHVDEKGDGYVKAFFRSSIMPTVGANGAIFRSSDVKEQLSGEYFYDIDLVARAMADKGEVIIAKVDVGIIHTYCESDMKKFIRKQWRRVRDYQFAKKSRVYRWDGEGAERVFRAGIINFILATILVLPLLYQAIAGYMKKKDPAWFFHIPACWLTLLAYSWGMIYGALSGQSLDRSGWRQ